jgi:thiopeptide-type bacteriocin biosynthesis protein
MPRYVALCKGDNEMLLDLENKHCLEIIREEMGKNKTITLKEFIQLPEQCLLGEGDQRVTNEIIIPFKVAGSTRLSGLLVPASDADTGPDRIFSIGSEWLYFKIYTGEKTADLLLKNVCRALCEESLAASCIDSWFFVRYNDPEFHLRVRMHSSQPGRVWQELIPRIQAALAPYLHNELVLKIQLDTYVREIERYGQNTMVASEELFFHDSQATLSWLQQMNGDGDEQSRWHFALCSVNAWLNDFDFSLRRKIRLMQRLSESYEAEFRLSQDERKQLNQQYRQELPSITEAVRGYLETMSGRTILAERSRNSTNAVLAIKALVGDHPSALEELIASYIHMSLNRLFISNPRQHELIIYSFLFKYYSSRAASPGKEALSTEAGQI